MQNDLIDELQDLTETLWARASLGECVKMPREPQDDGSTHVEIVAGRCDIVITEPASEKTRMPGLSFSDAARWFLFRVAADHAQAAELRDRSIPEDAPPIPYGLKDDGYSRWNWMAPTIETMYRISPDLGYWARQYYTEVFVGAPLEEYEKRNAHWPLPETSE